MAKKSDEEIKAANSINLGEFLIAHGENLIRSGNGYRMKEHDSLFIHDSKWFWNSRNIGGNNIRFIQQYYNKSFREAVEILNKQYSFSHNIVSDGKAELPVKRKKQEIHIEENTDCTRTVAYLTKTRRLDYNTVNNLIKQGKITEDTKHNAVFKIKDENNMTVGAELSGTSSYFKYKGIAADTAYGYGFEICRGKGENALFFESGIDMLSYLQMYENELDNHRLISMTGVKSSIIENTIERYNIPPEKVYICSDNDDAGHNLANKMIEKYPEMQRICPVEPYKDWNEILQKNFHMNIDFSNLKCYNKGGTDDMNKIQEVKQLYIASIQSISSSPDNWEKFLDFSAKLDMTNGQAEHNFSSKLLVYAKNPNATCCKTFDEWKNYDKSSHVERYSSGVPVLSVDENQNHKITYVFDVSDTNVNSQGLLNKNISENEKRAVENQLAEKYNLSGNDSLENQLAEIIHNETEKIECSEEIRSLLKKSLTYQTFQRYGIEVQADENFFENISALSVKDIANIGIGMNKIAVPLENLIEKTLENERKMNYEELRGRERNASDLVRGRPAVLSEVQDRGRNDLRAERGTVRVLPSDKDGRYEHRHRSVRNNEIELPEGTQAGRMADYDMGGQTVSALSGSQRTGNGYDGQYSGTENQISGISGSTDERRLHADSRTEIPVPEGSRGNSNSDNLRVRNSPDYKPQLENPDKKTVSSRHVSFTDKSQPHLKVLDDTKISISDLSSDVKQFEENIGNNDFEQLNLFSDNTNLQPDNRRKLFSIEQSGESREYENTGYSLFQLMHTYANSDKPYTALMDCGKPINASVSAEIEQSNNFAESVRMNFDEDELTVYKVDGNIEESLRTDKNSSIEHYSLSMVKDVIKNICNETSDPELQEQLFDERIESCNTKKIDNLISDESVVENTHKIENNSNNFRITDEYLGEGGAKTKFQNNIEAIKTLKAVEEEERQATPEEQEIMSKYVGWGGLSSAFDSNNNDWHKEYYQLKEILDEKEYEAACASTLDSFYTSPVITRAMYTALENMGFDGGNILEPSMGVGNFFGTMPEEMSKKSQLTGIELDSITGRIARQLYPDANIAINGFEKVKIENNTFDAVVGNIPFGNYSLNDKTKAYQNLKVHDYFCIKSLDKVRPGGIVAFVTSKGTMDKQNIKVRQMMAQKAEMLGAIRLPDNAFRSNAGTDVTSDIIFLQKREKPLKVSELKDCNWIHLSKTDDGIPVNQYFAENPHMILGTMEKSGRFDTTVCKAIDGADIKKQLEEAVKHIRGEYSALEFQPELNEKAADILAATPDILNYTYALVNDKIYYRRNDELVPLKESEQSGIKFERRKGMCEIADTTKALLNAQVEDRPDSEIKELQKQLNDRYNKFQSRYGYINKINNQNANSLFRNDVRFPLLQSLEHTDGERYLGKAKIFTERTITPHKAVEHTETSSEALIVSVSEKAKVDLDYMSELTGFEKDKITDDLKGVIYPVPELSSDDNIVYQTSDEYLSGNIYKKLDTAKASAEKNSVFADNISALEKAIPTPLKASEIDIRLGAAWLEPEIIQQFAYETFDTPKVFQQEPGKQNRNSIEVSFSPHGKGEWHIANKTIDRNNLLANTTYGTNTKNAYQILEDVLNMRDSKAFKTRINPDGKEVSVLDHKETTALEQKQELINSKFKDWLFSDIDRREQIVKQYNETFNCIKPREYDGSHLQFAGMNPEIKLKPHQQNAIAHALFGGNTLFAHEVGAGKTFEMIATAMEGKRLGLHNKSLFAVPNHLTEQIANDFMKLYPNANILVAKPDDFSTENRKKMCAKIATGNFDAVIIGHSQLIKIPISPEREQAYIKSQMDEITASIEAAKKNDGQNFTVKQLEKTKKSLKEKLEKLTSSTIKDQTVTFEELGVDKLFVDEAHLFKNLFLATKMSNISGISTNDNVQKTQDLYLKCQYLDEKTNGKGIVFATGTPVSNSMTEIYSMMKYLQSDMLKKHNLESFDSWASVFGKKVTKWELAPDGQTNRLKTRFAQFVNIPELMSMFKECADIKTAENLNLDVPECENHNICVKPSEMQNIMVESLSERAKAVQNGLVEPNEDNMLTITNDGRKIGLDERLLNPLAPDNPDSKLNACVKNVFDIWQKTIPDKSTQLIFCDLGVPQSSEDVKKNGKRFCVYDDIKQKLIAKGVPEKEIAFIHDAGNSETKKAQMFAKVRNGEIRVLIGSTAKMGAGTNVQTKLIASHDLDCPWKPADMTQRAGRMIRQGNENKKVHLYRYVTEKTFDSYLFQTLENKQNFIGQIMNSNTSVRSCDDVDEQALSYGEIKALCTGDPRIKERMELEVEVAKLKMVKGTYLSEKYNLEEKVLRILPKQIENTKSKIENIRRDIKKSESYTPVLDEKGKAKFEISIGNRKYSDKNEAGKALLEDCTKACIGKKDKAVVGEYKSFKITADFDSFNNKFNMNLLGNTEHTTELTDNSVTNINRLDRLISSMPQELEKLEKQLETLEKNIEHGKERLQIPFSKEKELQEKEARLIALTAELEHDEAEPDVKYCVKENMIENVPERFSYIVQQYDKNGNTYEAGEVITSGTEKECQKIAEKLKSEQYGNYEVYKLSSEHKQLKYLTLEEMKNSNQKLNINNYEKTLTGSLNSLNVEDISNKAEVLGAIYQNLSKDECLVTGDIVAFDKNSYYVNDTGFRPISNFTYEQKLNTILSENKTERSLDNERNQNQQAAPDNDIKENKHHGRY